MFARRTPLAQRILGAVDLAIDAATLGEYGLEQCPADELCRERPGRKTGWEALPQARPRGVCRRSGKRGTPRPPGGPQAPRVRSAFAGVATPAARRRLREAV